jgi:hypothetical protein
MSQKSSLNIRMSIEDKQALQAVMREYQKKNMSVTIRWLIQEKLHEKK